MDPVGPERGAPLVVAVLAGGSTGEREVSLATGAAVVEALQARGHHAIPVELESDGRTWRVGRDAGSPLGLLAGPLAGVDAFFLALHGGEGEDGTLQGFFTTLGLAHTGSGVAASALCMDKVATRRVLRAEGLRFAPGALAGPERERDELHAALAGLPGSERGLVVKPRSGGSSVATTVLSPAAPMADGRTLVADLRPALDAALDAVFATGDQALVEVRIPGVETTVGVLELDDGSLRALTPVEIRPAEGAFFDYEQKYSTDGAIETCPPASITAEVQQRLRELGLRAFRAARCRGHARVDFILPEDGSDPVLLEVNTLPGMTARSLLPLAAATDGLAFPVLCEQLARTAAGRRRHLVAPGGV